MRLYWEGSSSWRSAAPTVRMSANTSKPSNVHPRFEATSAFHCAPLSERYHGEDPKVPTSLMISSRSLPRHIPPEIAHEKLTLISRALGRVHQAPCPRLD